MDAHGTSKMWFLERVTGKDRMWSSCGEFESVALNQNCGKNLTKMILWFKSGFDVVRFLGRIMLDGMGYRSCDLE